MREGHSSYKEKYFSTVQTNSLLRTMSSSVAIDPSLLSFSYDHCNSIRANSIDSMAIRLL